MRSLYKTCTVTTPVEILTQTDDISQGTPLDEDLQVINGYSERKNQSFPGKSPLIGYPIPID